MKSSGIWKQTENRPNEWALRHYEIRGQKEKIGPAKDTEEQQSRKARESPTLQKKKKKKGDILKSNEKPVSRMKVLTNSVNKDL